MFKAKPNDGLDVINRGGDAVIKREFLESIGSAPVPLNPAIITTFRDELVPGSRDGDRRYECPMTVMTDSYKTTHFLMYEEAEEMRAYGECREKFDKIDDNRIVVYGTKYYIENFISRPLSTSDISAARTFLQNHILGPRVEKQQYFNAAAPLAKTEQMNYLDLLLKHGKWPVKIEAMPEGSVIRPNIPIYIITAKDEHSRLCTFLETILTMLWYPCSVATLSRHTKTLIEDAYKKSVPPPVEGKADDPTDITTKLGYQIHLESRLHDFGFRGCTCVEQSVLGGCAHLLNFGGSDTISAAYYAQFMLNGGIPVAKSIPATEHSVMTSFQSEIDAIKNLCDQFAGGMVACVWDAYNYERLLREGLPLVKDYVIAKKCTLIVRPDSGDATEQVLLALEYGEKAGFECTNVNGFKQFKNYAVIQGDGINYHKVKEILDAVMEKKYSACNVAFGMGGGLLQKVNRDTMSFATKLCYLRRYGGKEVHVMKAPKAGGKMSLPGKMMVLHEIDTKTKSMIGPHIVYTEDEGKRKIGTGRFKNSMQVIYDGTMENTTPAESQISINAFLAEKFQDVKNRLNREWQLPHEGSAIDQSLRDFQQRVLAEITAREFPKTPLRVINSEMQSNALPPSSTTQLLQMLDKLC